ncbi:hypothetical protein [Bacteroides thetaiotaomicron]|uniref:hypothetical protein n=1 Tax=Bacteroides thetaiotaomicron TaxID=818 RepID=UPI001F2B2DD6|nr:hypothetical protein [Bacteroides thetaiotaomicron]
MCKNELQHGGKLQLLTPEKYKGYACHPAEDRTTRQVVNATIERCADMNHWYDLKIVFEDGHIFEDSSASIRGCKQIFAFQCSAGSKWVNEELTNNEKYE